MEVNFMVVNQEIETLTNNLSHGQHKIVCPLCKNSRKNKRDKALSVNVDAERVVFIWEALTTTKALSLISNFNLFMSY